MLIGNIPRNIFVYHTSKEKFSFYNLGGYLFKVDHFFLLMVERICRYFIESEVWITCHCQTIVRCYSKPDSNKWNRFNKPNVELPLSNYHIWFTQISAFSFFLILLNSLKEKHENYCLVKPFQCGCRHLACQYSLLIMEDRDNCEVNCSPFLEHAHFCHVGKVYV